MQSAATRCTICNTPPIEDERLIIFLDHEVCCECLPLVQGRGTDTRRTLELMLAPETSDEGRALLAFMIYGYDKWLPPDLPATLQNRMHNCEMLSSKAATIYEMQRAVASIVEGWAEVDYQYCDDPERADCVLLARPPYRWQPPRCTR